jgi:RimJ/RimL family protein N-acetyltransferase
MAILETSRLTLRPFRKDDVDLLSELMANQDFMRFSLGVYTREQTQTVLEKFLSWNRAGRPSPFAVVGRSNSALIGYCGFLHWHLDGTDEIEIGYRLHPDYWNKGIATEAATAVRDHFPRFRTSARHFAYSPGKHRVPPGRGENRDDAREANYFSRLSNECVFSVSRAMGERECRLMNSRASAR